MSCNGCRVLRKGCSDSCILRPCLQWIESPEAQGHATVFVAKFFGRASLTGFITAVPENQRPALFQSLLYEACGRTVNPVFGAVGLLSSGNWSLCQAAVETVLRGGTLKPLPSASSSPPSIVSSCATTPSVSAQSCKQASPTQRSMAVVAAAMAPAPAPAPAPAHAFVQPPPSLLQSHLHSKRPLSECSVDLTTTVTVATDSLPSASPPPQLKRPRSAAATADGPQQLQHDIKSSNADLHHHGSILNPNLLAIKTEEEDETEAHPSAGKLVAPVPRRVRPHTIDHYHYHHQTVVRSAIQPSESGRPMAEALDNIELDLSLSSHANHDGLGANYPRVMSPCSMSVNSDCSVTSFELPCCPVRTPSPRQERQLLHLLL